MLSAVVFVKKSCSVCCLILTIFVGINALPCAAQILISAGAYANNFDSLGTANANWTNNLTLPDWYSSKGNGDATNYLAGTGSSSAGGMYSFGVTGISNSADRALGSVAASSINYAYGVRFSNDTAFIQTNIAVSYTGEEWRSGSTVATHTLAFSYQVGSGPLTNAHSGIWTAFNALSFVSPNLSGSGSALDGNATTNRQFFSNVNLTGVTVQPGQELFVRWLDVDDTGFDNGLAIDDVAVSFGGVSPSAAPIITTEPTSQIATQGDNVTFTVAATGNPAPGYQWQLNGTSLAGATTTSLNVLAVTTNQSGGVYSVLVTNSIGTTNSQTATLTVFPQPPAAPSVVAVSLLTYNLKGNGATNWSTNAAQVKAIGRQLVYLNPDVITFNEIPWDLRYEMTNWITVFLPGYHLAVSTNTDGFICNGVASRYPILRSNSWLYHANLQIYGYTNSASTFADNFTRDFFEAQIVVPGFPQHLHVFTTHLKSSSGGYADAAAKRAAEAAAITNFFATTYFVLYPNQPYTLSGDMNEDSTNTLAIQRLISPMTGLRLTNPTNPFTGSSDTYATTTANPSSRLDYIFPCPLLFSNIASSQVFRTDKLNPVPPNLLSNDCKVGSDHLPVLMAFANPYDKPFRLLTLTRSNPTVTLTWQSVLGQPYRVESSSNLSLWTVLATNLVATNSTFTYSTNLPDAQRYFRIYRVP